MQLRGLRDDFDAHLLNVDDRLDMLLKDLTDLKEQQPGSDAQAELQNRLVPPDDQVTEDILKRESSRKQSQCPPVQKAPSLMSSCQLQCKLLWRWSIISMGRRAQNRPQSRPYSLQQKEGFATFAKRTCDSTFATFVSKCSNRFKPFNGQRGQSYADWEDHFDEAFGMPVSDWSKLATTYLQDAAMKTWKRCTAHKQPSDVPSWPEFTQAMNLYFGDPSSHLQDLSKLEKLSCNHSTLAAFTTFTREHQQLQMRLGEYDGKSIAQHVQQYIKGLPEDLYSLLVSHVVTNPDAYNFLPMGQHLGQDLFLKLGQSSWLQQHCSLCLIAAAQPSGTATPTLSGAYRRASHAGQKGSRDEAEAPAAQARRPVMCRVYKQDVNVGRWAAESREVGICWNV